MSVETLNKPDQGEITEIDTAISQRLGKTVFEALAVEADKAMDQPEESADLRFVNSVTRRGDGQTTPDE